MAREPLLDTILIGAVGAGAAAIIGTQALEYYRERYRRSGPSVVCTECGEEMPIGDVLDPAVTCACATSNIRTD